jgi:hypothetical protein
MEGDDDSAMIMVNGVLNNDHRFLLFSLLAQSARSLVAVSLLCHRAFFAEYKSHFYMSYEIHLLYSRINYI